MSDDSKWGMAVPSRQRPSGTCLKPNKVGLLPFSFYKFHTYYIRILHTMVNHMIPQEQVIGTDFLGDLALC